MLKVGQESVMVSFLAHRAQWHSFCVILYLFAPTVAGTVCVSHVSSYCRLQFCGEIWAQI